MVWGPFGVPDFLAGVFRGIVQYFQKHMEVMTFSLATIMGLSSGGPPGCWILQCFHHRQGASDGVGEWFNKFGVNPRSFADELMSGCPVETYYASYILINFPWCSRLQICPTRHHEHCGGLIRFDHSKMGWTNPSNNNILPMSDVYFFRLILQVSQSRWQTISKHI